MRQKVESKKERKTEARKQKAGRESGREKGKSWLTGCVREGKNSSGRKFKKLEKVLERLYLAAISDDEPRPVTFPTCRLRPPSLCSRLLTSAHKMHSLPRLTYSPDSSLILPPLLTHSRTVSSFLAHHRRLRFFFINRYKIVIVPLSARNAPEVPVCTLKPTSVGSLSIVVGGELIYECEAVNKQCLLCLMRSLFNEIIVMIIIMTCFISVSGSLFHLWVPSDAS